MAAFFKEETKEAPKEESKEPKRIKVGEKKYTNEELQVLVGLGGQAKEWEDKGGAKFGDLRKKFGKRGERIGDLKKQIEALEKAQVKSIADKPQEKLTEEELAIKVKEEAKKYGLLTTEGAEQIAKDTFNRLRSGEKILARVNTVLRQAKKAGKPVTTPEKMLEFMADPDNPKNPDKAYKLMFEKELDEWKEKKMKQAKPKGIFTEEKASAKKEPKREPITRDNLDDKLKSIFQG